MFLKGCESENYLLQPMYKEITVFKQPIVVPWAFCYYRPKDRCRQHTVTQPYNSFSFIYESNVYLHYNKIIGYLITIVLILFFIFSGYIPEGTKNKLKKYQAQPISKHTNGIIYEKELSFSRHIAIFSGLLLESVLFVLIMNYFPCHLYFFMSSFWGTGQVPLSIHHVLICIVNIMHVVF